MLKPRPFNPELNINFAANAIPSPALIPIQPNLNPMPIQPINTFHPSEKTWRESDFQLAVVPSSSLSLSVSSSTSSSELLLDNEREEDVNSLLQRSGLPQLDFSKLEYSNKDVFVFFLSN